MAKKTLIIEVEEKIVKIAVSTKSGKKVNISDSFMFRIPDRAVVDGQIVDPESLAEIVNAQILRHNLTKIKNAYFALTSTKVVNKEVEIPGAVKEKRIKSVIETNANDYFPVDMSNYQIAYTILDKTKERYRVLVLAAPRMMINGYVRLANALNIHIEAIDFSGNSQYQALKKFKDEQVVAYVDCNLTNTFVNFIENGDLVLQRSFQVGGDNIIRTFMKSQARDDSKYLTSLEDMADSELMDVVFPMEDRRQSADRFLHNIARIMEFFQSNYGDKQISQIVLLGTYSYIAGLKEMVADITHIPTIILAEKEGADSLGADLQGINYYVSCLGAQLKPIDFLPPEYKARKKKGPDTSKAGKNTLVACLLLSALMCGFGYFRYYTASTELENLQTKLDRMEKVQQIYDTYLKYERINGHFEILDNMKHTPNAELVAFFEELEEKMPSAISVLSAVCDDSSVSMNVTVSNLEQAATTIAQLRSFETIQDIQVSSLSESKDRAGATQVSFSISCTYNMEAFAPAEEAAQ